MIPVEQVALAKSIAKYLDMPINGAYRVAADLIRDLERQGYHIVPENTP